MPLTPLQRKARLIEYGIVQTALAEEMGVTKGMISFVVAGERRSARIEAAIAEKLGMPVEDVFGPPATDTETAPCD